MLISGCKKEKLTCNFVSPVDGAELSLDKDLVITVEAIDSKNGSVIVVVYLENTPYACSLITPYTVTIPTILLPVGKQTLRAVATNMQGIQAESSISVTFKEEGGGSEEESPGFVTFSNGKIPISWKTDTWVVENALGFDDSNSLRADRALSIVATNKTFNNVGYVEFYLRSGGGDFFEFYIDGNKASALSSSPSGDWKKWTYTVETGKHSFRWENTNAATIHLDAIKFAAATLPTVTTKEVSNITASTAISGGNITHHGNNPITARGVCWSTSENPTISDSKTVDGTSMGSFTSNITKLFPNTLYYVRAYATNNMGTAYGEPLSFTTMSGLLPTVTTADISKINYDRAVGGGVVTHDGNSVVTERGVCWSTSQNPTTNNQKIVCGAGTGSFTGNISYLTLGNTYYVRAYAINVFGTAYGEQKSFKTILKVGDNYLGHTVAYVDDTGKHGFFVSSEDEHTVDHYYKYSWSRGYTLNVTGATETAIGSGKRNTDKIIQVEGEGEGKYAAKACRDKGPNWFLPSKDELSELYKNRNILLNFSPTDYWCSTEMEREYAWERDFSNGEFYGYLKSHLAAHVRCILEF